MLFGKVALQIPRIMQYAQNLNHVTPAAIDEEMPGMMHHSEVRSGAVAAETQMVDEDSLGEFRALQGTWTFGIGTDIAEGLGQQRTIAQRRVFAELAQAPAHHGGYVTPGGACDPRLVFAVLSQASVQPLHRLRLPRGAGA